MSHVLVDFLCPSRLRSVFEKSSRAALEHLVIVQLCNQLINCLKFTQKKQPYHIQGLRQRLRSSQGVCQDLRPIVNLMYDWVHKSTVCLLMFAESAAITGDIYMSMLENLLNYSHNRIILLTPLPFSKMEHPPFPHFALVVIRFLNQRFSNR